MLAWVESQDGFFHAADTSDAVWYVEQAFEDTWQWRCEIVKPDSCFSLYYTFDTYYGNYRTAGEAMQAAERARKRLLNWWKE